MRILGVDPGSTATGFGVVDHADGRVVHVAHGILRPPRTASLALRLAHIHLGLSEIVALHEPDSAVIEKVFLASNPRSALVLGQARGAALAALAAAGLTVGELAAREVKKAVVGHGGAAKAQVQTMVTKLLGLRTEPASDAADALAVAICQAHAGRLAGLDLRGSRRRRSVRARHAGEWTGTRS
jgi:crossover junction endodeoxyribonuclease RuvC